MTTAAYEAPAAAGARDDLFDDGGPEEEPRIRIRPSRPLRSLLNLREVWEFRDLLLALAGRDVKLRYRQTALGAAWVVLQPLVGAGIFSLVFGRIAKMPSDGAPYLLFSYAGLMAWTLFSGTLTKSSGSLVGSANLISKIYFPRLILPLSTVCSVLIDFAVSLAMLAVLMAIFGVAPHAGLLLLPVWMLLLLLLASGVGLMTSALAVSYRDIQYVLPVLVQFLLYGSPVAYAASAVPAELRGLYYLNPLASLLEGFRWSVLGTGAAPDAGAVGYSAAVALAVFAAGVVSFRKMERRFADVI